MRPCNNLINTPPTLGSKGSEKTTEGRHPLGFLLSGPGAIRSGRQSPPGGPDSASRFPRRYTLPFIALLAVLAAGLLFLLPGGLLQAQDDGMIEYAENGTDAVATYTADDPEDRMVYWSLLEAAGNIEVDGTSLIDADVADFGDFSISADGVLTFNIPPDHESPDDVGTDNEYNIVVVASDDAPGAGTTDDPIEMGYKKVVVTVTDVDEPGMVSLSSLQPQVGVELMATLTDPAVEPAQINAATWKWEKSQDMSSWSPVDGAGETNAYTPDGTTDGYYLRAMATYADPDGEDRPAASAVSANKVRMAPTTTDATAAFPDDAGARTVNENSPAGTEVGDPVAANDTVDDVLTYSLSGAGAGSFDIDPADGQITVGSRAMLDHETMPTYTVTVTAREASGDTDATETVTITVRDVNEAPMVTGGVTMMEHMEDDADVDTDDTTVLTVSTYAASDPEDDTPVFSIQGADASKFMIDSSSGALTFKEAPNYEMPADVGMDNEYNVTVVATDDGTGVGDKMTAMREVTIMVTNAEEDGTVTLSAQQPKIGVALTASVTDPDGTPTDVTWKWERDNNLTDDTDNNDPGEEVIEGATMATYTPTSDDNGSYLRAIATYTDGKGKDTSMETSVAVVEVRTDNPPMFPDTEDGKRSIEEGMTGVVGDPVRATDAEEPQLLTYSLSRADAGSFSITSDTGDAENDRGGQISVKAGVKLDYETKPSYMVTVTATDPDDLSASIAVTIMVTDDNEAPMVTGDAEKEYAENGTRSVATYTADDPEDRMVYWSLLEAAGNIEVDGTSLIDADVADFGDFSISADGVLTFNIPPDHESPDDVGTDNEYNIVVVASDDAPGAGTTDDPIEMGYKKVVVTVTDVDEPGMVSLSSLQPQVGVELMATLTDPAVEPAQINAAEWKWEKSRSRTSGWTAIGGTGTETAAYAPVDTTSGYYLRAMATYADPDGEDRPAASAVSANKVRMAPTTTDENAAFPDDAGARTVNENSPAGTEVGDPVAANDTEDDVLTYSLSGAGAGSFDIDPADGQITVGSRAMLDHETMPTYTVTVTAREASGDTDTTETVTITVRDVNEAPMVTGGVTMMEHMEDDADVDTDDTTVLTVSTYAASDPEDDTPVFSIQGADASKFMIDSSSGALTFKEAPNYEMPADVGMDNEYNVTVVATDDGTGVGDKMTAMREVTIMVTNAEEDGTVTLSAQQPKIGVALTASVTDPDGTPTDVTWKWERDNNLTDDTDNNDPGEEVIEGATMATYTPTSDDNGSYLRAIATYTDGKGKDTSMETSVAVVEVRTDNPPMFPDTEDGKRYIVEGGTGDVFANSDGTTAGTDEDPVRATDAEEPQLLTYSLSGANAGSFEIASDTGTGATDRGGQISVKSGVKLNYETKSSYMVTVTATDPDNLKAMIDVTIMVVDVDEMPTIMVGGLAISGLSRAYYAEKGMDAVGTYTLAGPMKDSARLRIEGGADAGDFRLNNGMLMFRSSPDYEAPADADTDNTYMVTLKATDGTYMDTHNVMVMVTNVEELGTLSGDSNPSYMEDGDDAVGTYTASGGTMSGMANWSLMGDDMDDLSISTGGELTFDATPDFEMPMDQDMDNTYMVTVMASAGGEMDTQDVMVMVTNMDEMGEVTLWAGMDALTMAPQVGDTITGAVMDPDGNPGDMPPIAMDTTINDVTWQWSRTTDTADMNSWMDIQDATDAAYMVTAGDAGYYLRVMATYTDAAGTDMEHSMPTMMVGAEAGDTLLDRYDADNNGQIDRPEVLGAIRDFVFNQTIEREDVVAVIRLFVFRR